MNSSGLTGYKQLVLCAGLCLIMAGCAGTTSGGSNIDATETQNITDEITNLEVVNEGVDESADTTMDYVQHLDTVDATYSDTLDVDTFKGPEFCKGTTRLLYDPLNSDELQLWPDDRLTRPDKTSPTGIRLNVTPGNAKWTTRVPGFIKGAMSQFQTLSGFALNGAVLMRFSAPIAEPPAKVEDSLASGTLLFEDLDAKPPAKVAYEARLGDDGKDLFVQPVLPLKPGRHYAVVMTSGYKAADKGCIAPSKALKAMLTLRAGNEAMNRTGRRMLDALDRMGLQAGEVSAMTVFTTEDDIEVIKAAAKDAQQANHDWVERQKCTVKDNIKACDVKFEASDYRKDEFIASPDPKAQWEVPATIWMPADKTGPFPVILYGHGLGGDRYQGRGIARLECPKGFAVIAAPALRHGEHPSTDDPSKAGYNFLGFDLKTVTFNPLKLRGNFNQTTLDRIRLLATMLKYPDVDGDGHPDVAKDKVVYWWISLGALLGPSIVALESSIKAAIFSVGGGRLMLFATTGENVQQLKPVIIKLAGSEERFDRLVVAIQTLVDAADPATYAPYVLKDHLDGSKFIPSVLFPVADHDNVVPPPCGRALAQALGIPQMRPVSTPVPLLKVIDSPVHGNLTGGYATAAYFQFDRVGGQNPNPAKHNNTPGSPEAILQASHFWDTWLDDGVGEIIDPYPIIGTPELPPGDSGE